MTGPLSPQVLGYEIPAPGEPDISPDSDRLVYTLRSIDAGTGDRRSQLWLCDADGDDARRLAGRGGRGGRWSPDGTEVAFCGPVDGGHGLWVVGAEPDAAPREVTRHDTEIDELGWSPDGRAVAYTCEEDPDGAAHLAGTAPPVRVTRRIDYKEDGRGFLGDRRSHVFVVDVASGDRRRLTAEPFDHDAPQWAPDGRRLAVRVTRGDRGGASLVLLDVEAAASDPITSGSGRIGHWAWSPAGDRLVFTADPEHSFSLDFFSYELATRTTRRLTDDLGADLESHPVWVDDRSLLFSALRGGASGIEVLDTTTGAVQVLARWPAWCSGLRADRARRRIVQVQTTMSEPPQLAVFDRDTGRTHVVTEHGAAVLDAHPPATWERLEVRNGDVSIEAWLLRPPDFDPERRYPLVLDVHGGPTACHGHRFLAHQQCLATNGFLVLAPNPRGSSSYGGDFARMVVRDWGYGDYSDLLAVLDAVVTRPYVDAARTGIFGISYGGYLTAWAISQTDRFAAAVCGEPIFDIASYYGTSDVGFNGMERHAGGPPHSDPQWYAAHSPASFAHRTRTPTLIFHGEADHRCPIGQSEQMFVALQRAGCESEYVRYPGGSHMFFVTGPPEHRTDFLTRVLGWFSEHLGGPE